MLLGITNQWTEVDWAGLDSQKRQKEVTHTTKQVGWGRCNFQPGAITLVADMLVRIRD